MSIHSLRKPLQGKQIILGVSGSIACYKAADLASKLTQAGAKVDTILTDAATKFVTPLTFQAVTGRRAYTNADLWGQEAHVLHVGLAHQANLLVIAPASANTLTKLVQGSSDDLLSLTALAATCPLLLAPAMDGGMYSHPATQETIQKLSQRGAIFVGPEEGHLASGLVARGRMSEPMTILGQIQYTLTRGGALKGRKIVVTAGGTREALDPVRFLANRSSGKQGYALAQAALNAGGDVVLVTTTTALPTPAGARIVQVESAQEMLEAVLSECADADVLIMAAAVADFRSATMANQKIKKQIQSNGYNTKQGMTLELMANPDILETVAQQKSTSWRVAGRDPLIVVGFAAETEALLENGRAKLERKQLNLLVANDVSAKDAGFAVDTNRVSLLHTDGKIESLPLMDKLDVAAHVIERVIALLPTA